MEDHNKLRVDQCPFCHQTIPEEITEKTSQMIRRKFHREYYKEVQVCIVIEALNPIEEEDKIPDQLFEQIESLINRTTETLNEPVESVAGRIKDAKNQLQALQAIIDAEKHQYRILYVTDDGAA